MSGRVFVLPALQELEEFLGTPLLKETHERALHGLHLVTGDLRDLAIAVHKAARDLLELKVPSDIGMDANLGQFTGCDDELGDQVHRVVAIAAKICRGCLVWPELAIELAMGYA